MRTFTVDAFTHEPFRGNPAGVCLHDQALPEAFMLQVAQELGLSETAFLKPTRSGYDIRFFSPVMEIPLCGHATLSSAAVVFEQTGGSDVTFTNIQGIELTAQQIGDQIRMTLPVYKVTAAEVPPETLASLGIQTVEDVQYNAETRILMLVVESAEAIAALTPDFEALKRSHDAVNGVLVTAPSNDGYDYHSRYFWPWSGTNEDPVTGGTQTFLAPYWAEKLGKQDLRTYQSSPRGGSMDITVGPKTLSIDAYATIMLEGELRVAPPVDFSKKAVR